MPADESDNIVIVRSFVEAENRHDIDAIAPLVADDCEFYGNGILVAPSWAAYRPIMEATLSAFPDSHREVLQMAAQGDLVAFRWTVTGTHSASWNGISASGKAVVLDGTSWIRVAHGRTQTAWFDMDLAGPLRQMTGG